MGGSERFREVQRDSGRGARKIMRHAEPHPSRTGAKGGAARRIQSMRKRREKCNRA